MSVEASRRVSVEDREREIFAFVRGRRDGGATVREIFEGVSQQLDDAVTIQAYYKLVDRMVATEKLDVVEDEAAEGGRRHVVAPYLHAENALTLDDVYALLDELEPSDAIARVIDAREYFEERRGDTLLRAALALRDEDPRELVDRFLLDRVCELQADLGLLALDELRDRELEARVGSQLRELRQFAYRYLGLSRAAIDAPYELAQGRGRLRLNEEELKRELELRVFGSKAIELVDVNEVDDPQEWNRTAVAGSDGSTHGGVLQIATARTFIDDLGSQVVTFNNSVVYLDLGASQRLPDRTAPYYSVPMSRSAIDDRSNRGMVMAPFMYRYLSESEYEHMAKCATDVVQWRADETVFLGKARALGTGALLPKPKVHIRDGTITPQEREYGHYRRFNEYGDMVREGIAHSRIILDRVISTPGAAVFAGAVKTTQARLFAPILNWYIARGSRPRFGEPLDPTWDMTRAAHIPDNEAMSFLLATLNDERGDGQYFTTFQVMRPFHSLTEYYGQPDRDEPRFWLEFFREKQRREQRDYEAGDDPQPSWLTQVSDVEDEDYVYMCANADYVAFYIGHTGGEPPPVAPRYEFLEALRRMDVDAACKRVARNVRLLVAAIDRSQLAADRDHNFLSRKTLVKIIPYVIMEAHEKCKALGRQLDNELRSIVIANLQGIRRARDLDPRDVQLLPLSIRRFVERYRAALEERATDEGEPFER
jgi:hypothetical protein